MSGSSLVPTAELPNGKKIYTIRGQVFEVPAAYRLCKLVGFGSYGIVCSAAPDPRHYPGATATTTGASSSSGNTNATTSSNSPQGAGAAAAAAATAATAASSAPAAATVAIKRVPRVLDGEVAEGLRALREMEILSRVRHPNLIRMRHFVLPESRAGFSDVYYVMDLYATDLERIIRSRQRLTEEHRQYFMVQAFRGLAHLHAAGVMHRDLKPGNLLVNADCALAICDFGLARDDASAAAEAEGGRPDSSSSRAPAGGGGGGGSAAAAPLTQYVVTRWYRAPEVLGMGARPYTSAVDVWSLGLIFAELVVGSVLLPGPDYISQLNMIVGLLGTPTEAEMAFLSPDARAFILAQPPRPRRTPPELFPSASPAAAALLARLLQFDPARRPTAAQVLADPYFASFASAAAGGGAEGEEAAPAAPPVYRWRHAGITTRAALRDALWEVMAAHAAPPPL